MFRRWLIRSLALSLLTLCAVAWVGSYWRSAFINYGKANPLGGHTETTLVVATGRLALERFDPGELWGEGWDFHVASPMFEWSQWEYNTGQPHRWGFAFRRDENLWCLTIPLWFPTLLSALLLCLVGRFSRAKSIGQGFPVEPTAKAKEV